MESVRKQFEYNMLEVNQDQISAIGRVLNDQSRPLKERFRALFTLKNIGGPKAIEQIHNCFKDESALLKHELAYCLGQMQDSYAIPILIEVLKDITQEPMVRHEAGTVHFFLFVIYLVLRLFAI